MKKSLIILFVFGLYFSIHGQELMTIREVFNFEVGDKFQIKGEADNEPPNADRIEIIGKYYSANEDTLYYIRFHDSYYSNVIWGEDPYLEYHFWIKTDTVFYTNLDSSIVNYDHGFESNQYIENSSKLCGSLINGCSYASGPGFEDDYITNEYGQGLGQTYAYYFSGQGNAVLWSNSLFYYKKGDNECGSPDTLTVGIDEITSQVSEFSVYPNPVNSVLYIENDSQVDNFHFTIINSRGQIIMSMPMKGKQTSINTTDLAPGIYFVKINNGNKLITRKFIKK